MASDEGARSEASSDTTVRVVVAANPFPGHAEELELTLPAGSTIDGALMASGLLERYPTLQCNAWRTGIWGTLQPRSTVLNDGDRVELYRPLANDPKEARRLRARSERKAKRARCDIICSRRRSRPGRVASRRHGPGRRGIRARRSR